MTGSAVMVKPDDSLEDAIGIMEKTGYRALPVYDGSLVGLITQRDIVKKIK
jgi:CBS domain-containing protein